MDDENNKPRAGVSRSFIFSIFLILGIIALVAYFIFSNSNGADHLKPYQYSDYLINGNITEVQYVSASTRKNIYLQLYNYLR